MPPHIPGELVGPSQLIHCINGQSGEFAQYFLLLCDRRLRNRPVRRHRTQSLATMDADSQAPNAGNECSLTIETRLGQYLPITVVKGSKRKKDRDYELRN